MAIFHIALILSCLAFTHTLATNETNSQESLTTNIPEEDEFKDKHESFQDCSSVLLDPDEYVIFPNRTAFVAPYNRSYNESLYILRDDGTLAVCAPKEIEEDRNEIKDSVIVSEEFLYLTKTGVAVSVFFTFIHLVVFAIVKDLRNLPGYNLASLCLSLLLSYIFMALQSSAVFEEMIPACIATAVLTQFFFLGAHIWMSVMAFDVFLSILHATGSLRVSSKSFKMKKFLYSSFIAWGISGAFTIAAVLADNIDGVDPEYKPDFVLKCWFRTKQTLLAFFAGPIMVIICINFILFSISAYCIFHNRMKASEESQRTNLRKSHLMYFRLAVIMGVTWFSGAVAPLVNQLWLWYVFAALNTFQGLFIFIAFTCAKKVRKFFYSKFLSGRRTSQQTLSPTFQSYCFYANSIEKDLDKVVESKGKTGPIDTVMIHL